MTDIINPISDDFKNSEKNTILEFIEMKKRQENVFESKKLEALHLAAKQVSHDIRSPLSALNMMLGQMNQLPESQRIMMRGAIQRINDISNELLTKGKQIQGQSASTTTTTSEGTQIQLSIQLLSPLIDTIVSEKRVQHREKQNIEIVPDIDQGYGLFANINLTELSRTVSNLLNNAIEAFPEAKGRVIVAIRGYPDLVSIIIPNPFAS